ncbi:magnesium transporter [Candidatus Atribacteria bacterium RBG_19FT_COMBO_35_14]|uniref:Magnesium transporter MgtE n=1 Tax=Candidatus Sediminicultor quintus TaxID=1797291 RepID=A0A1F5AAM5_9BACT|nr:MAG: magnesium transporter [Candidatus Atribacteria bacterium RBG_19FT_COMBO_35_14]
MKGISEKIIKLLEEKKIQEVKEIIFDLYPTEFVEVTHYLPLEQTVEIFKLIKDDEKIAELLSELNSELQANIMDALGKEKASDILEEMDTDEAADFLGEITPRESRELLDLMPKEEAKEIEELLKYKENTAGSIMNNEFVALPEDLTAEEAINKIRELSPEAEMIYYIYIVDKREKLIGVISLRDLIMANPKAKISKIVEEDVVSVLDTEDQETAARIIADYDFLAIPVINRNGTLLGIITVDDIIDVLQEEVTEDIHKMVGSSEVYEDKLIKASPLTRAKARLSWLFVCMAGGVLAGSVIKFYSDILQSVVALAFFIPVIIDMGGNVGTQSSTITVRALATGQLRTDELARNIWAETKVGLLIGLIVGIALSVVALIWQNNFLLGIVIGLSLCITLVVAAAIGTLLPLIFTKIKVDPAIASGPLITTIIDMGGLFIYFSIGSLIFKYFG